MWGTTGTKGAWEKCWWSTAWRARLVHDNIYFQYTVRVCEPEAGRGENEGGQGGKRISRLAEKKWRHGRIPRRILAADRAANANGRASVIYTISVYLLRKQRAEVSRSQHVLAAAAYHRQIQIQIQIRHFGGWMCERTACRLLDKSPRRIN